MERLVDSVLNGLVSEALANNRDLRIATARRRVRRHSCRHAIAGPSAGRLRPERQPISSERTEASPSSSIR